MPPKKKTQLRIVVSDTGIGIPASKSWTLYLKNFSRQTALSLVTFGGTGLGLDHIPAVGKPAWRRDGAVESEVGKGSHILV